MGTPQTLAEKILSHKVGRCLRPGDIGIFALDLVYFLEMNALLYLSKLAKIDRVKIFDRRKVLMFLGELTPSCNSGMSTKQNSIRRFAELNDLTLFDAGTGISHQIVAERYARPGDITVGANSHACLPGAVGAFAVPMGSTDVGVAMALGKTWMRVPETIRFTTRGRFAAGVGSKDLILHIIGTIGANGANYMAMEFDGPAIREMCMDDRITLTVMAVEAGGKVGLIPSDRITKEYLEAQGRGGDWSPVEPDPGAHYARTVEIDLDSLEPTVSAPHLVDNTRTAREVAGTKLDQVYIGSCTNGQLRDIEIAANILRGKRVHPKTRLMLIPASQQVYRAAMEKGYLMDIFDAGGVICPPSCGPCNGVRDGTLGKGEVCLATQNRNFKGRMGDKEAQIFLGSPATAAASALAGEIRDPREVL